MWRGGNGPRGGSRRGRREHRDDEAGGKRTGQRPDEEKRLRGAPLGRRRIGGHAFNSTLLAAAPWSLHFFNRVTSASANAQLQKVERRIM
jgi:hypothetical protein